MLRNIMIENNDEASNEGAAFGDFDVVTPNYAPHVTCHCATPLAKSWEVVKGRYR
jgi:hypothetical protein